MTLLGSIDKRLLASAFIVLLQVASATVSPAQTIPKKNDVLVVTTPHFRREEQHGNEIASKELGRIGNDVYTFLDFKVGGKTYRTWWKSFGTSAPVYLAEDVRYKFLIRLDHKASECQVLKIWRRQKLIWRNDKLAWQAPSPDERDIREELASIAARQMEAFKDKDVKVYLSFVTRDYSTKTVEGIKLGLSRPELEAATLSEMQDTLSVQRSTREIKDLSVKGKEVTVVVDQKSSRVLREGDSQHQWEAGLIQKEVWILTDEGLKISSIEVLKIVYLIKDGEPEVGQKNRPPRRKRGRAARAFPPTSSLVDAPAISHVFSNPWSRALPLSGPTMPSAMSTAANSHTE